MLTLAYGGEGGDQPKYYMLTEGGVRQMLTHPKCCKTVRVSERDNAFVL